METAEDDEKDSGVRLLRCPDTTSSEAAAHISPSLYAVETMFLRPCWTSIRLPALVDGLYDYSIQSQAAARPVTESISLAQIQLPTRRTQLIKQRLKLYTTRITRRVIHPHSNHHQASYASHEHVAASVTAYPEYHGRGELIDTSRPALGPGGGFRST